MYDNQKYNLDSGPFGLCSGYWDEKTNSFKKSGSTDTYKCCLSSCIPNIEECNKLCNSVTKGSTTRCNKICKDIEQSCNDYCELATPRFWGMDDPMYDIIKDFGCGSNYYDTIDIKCMERNKDKIISICNKNCIPTISIGCKNHCKYMYDLLTKSLNLKIKKTSQAEYKSFIENNNNNSNYVSYILYSILIVFILVAFYYIFKQK
jgi:hypothetical protein